MTTDPAMTDPAAAKAALRRLARERRAAAAIANPEAAGAIARAVLDSDIAAPDAVVAGYAPIGDEIDPMPLLEALATTRPCGLPVIGKGRVLTFRQWRPGVTLVAGRYGIPAPPLDLPTILPDILLVPLLAFDRAGHRVGYGGGYYDTTLAALRAARAIKAIGLAYAAQEIERLPAEAFDQPLDAVATERGLIVF